MKNLAIILFLIGMTAFGQEGQTITVEITNIDSEDGQMLVALYDKESQWLKDIYMGAIGEIENGKSTITFTNVPKGVYAVSTFHDEDGNNKLNMFLGIPTEDTGASNNAPARMGPPKWEDAKFTVAEEVLSLSIQL